jgi:hypothetical protein
MNKMTRQQPQAIAGVKYKPRTMTINDEPVVEDTIEYKLTDRLKAVEMIAKHHFLLFKGSGCGDEHLGEIGIDAPISHVARDLAAKTHVVKLGLGHAQADLNIPQALAKGQLGKGHAQILVPTGEAFDLVVAVVALDAFAKLVGWNEIHQLRKNRLACGHASPPVNGIPDNDRFRASSPARNR